MPSSSSTPFPDRAKLSIHSACFYAQASQPVLTGALQVEIFDDINPGPSFEEVFPEHAFYEESEGSESSEEIEEAELAECYYAEFGACPCCQGFVYNCDGIECHFKGVCDCVGDKHPQPHHFQVKWTKN